MQIGAQTFLGARADTWAAIGIWLTLVVYVVIALVAARQLSEARRLRQEQARPFVLVDVNFRSILIELVIENIGQTAARDVKVQFEEPLESTNRDPDWQASTAFTEGIPMMAPGRRIRFFLDSYLTRHESELPMVIRGAVSYSGPTDRYCEEFVIDLTVYEGSAVDEKGMTELVESVEKSQKLLHDWLHGKRAPVVKAYDGRRQEIIDGRPYNLRRARREAADGRWWSFVAYYVRTWRRRGGWYSR